MLFLDQIFIAKTTFFNLNKTVWVLVFLSHFDASQPQFFSCLCTFCSPSLHCHCHIYNKKIMTTLWTTYWWPHHLPIAIPCSHLLMRTRPLWHYLLVMMTRNLTHSLSTKHKGHIITPTRCNTMLTIIQQHDTWQPAQPAISWPQQQPHIMMRGTTTHHDNKDNSSITRPTVTAHHNKCNSCRKMTTTTK